MRSQAQLFGATVTHSTADARTFLSSWFGEIPDDLAIEVRTKSADARVQHRFFDSASEVSLDDIPPTSQVWFGTGLRKRGATTGMAKDVVALPGLWIDVDAVDPADLLRRMRPFVAPTFVIVNDLLKRDHFEH